MRKLKLLVVGLLFTTIFVNLSCEKDDEFEYELEAIDKEEVEDPDDRGNG
ncbi:MAG: hypothetical protein AAGL34_04135 [Bacteroidota bacterium]